MTTDELREIFEREDDEFLKFERIESPRHPRPDLCAFLMLHDLVPGDSDMVAGASHDEIHLDVREEDLAAVVTEAQVIDLRRCGVRMDGYGLCMFA